MDTPGESKIERIVYTIEIPELSTSTILRAVWAYGRKLGKFDGRSSPGREVVRLALIVSFIYYRAGP
jgi:hypothetical protein